MPTRTCGRRNCSPRYQLVEDSLAPGKSRMGNHLRPLQIHTQNKMNMLCHGIFGTQRTGGGMLSSWEFFNRHASDFNPGFVTFVGEREPGIW